MYVSWKIITRASVLLFTILVGGDIAGQSSFRLLHLDKTDGLSQNSVFAIAEDHLGQIWVGTRNGTNVFDGHQFKTYYKNDVIASAIPSNDVRVITYDSKDSLLWIGSGSGLAYYDYYLDRFVSYHLDSLNRESETIRCIYTDGDTKYFGTESGLYTTTSVEAAARRLVPLDHVVKALATWNDRLLIGTDAGMYTYDFRSQQLSRSSLLRDTTIHIKSIDKGRDGSIWVGTQEHGLYKIDANNNFVTNFHEGSDRYPLSNNNIRDLSIDDQDRVWIGTFMGLNIYDPKTDKLTTIVADDLNPEGLRNSSIRSLWLDKNGNTWIGTYYGGLHIYSASINAFRIIKHHPLVPSLSVDHVGCLQQVGRTLYIGTEGGGINLVDLYTDQITPTPDYLLDFNSRSSNIKELFHDYGQLYVGTFSNGLSIIDLDNKTIRTITSTEGLKHQNVYAIARADQSSMWIGTYGGGLYKYNKQSGRCEPADLVGIDIPVNIRTLEVDGATLWIGADSGLYRCTHITSTDRYQVTSVLKAPVYSHYIMNEQMWIGTFGDGLYMLDKRGNVIDNYRTTDGLPDNVVLGIIPHGDDLWLSTSAGLCRYDHHKRIGKVYQQTDESSAFSFSYNAFTSSSDGRLHFGGVNGLLSFDPSAIPDDLRHPTFSVKELYHHNKVVRPTLHPLLDQSIRNTRQLEFADGDASFALEAGYYGLESTSRTFAYRIEGLSPEWSYATGHVVMPYTIQKDGDYILELRGQAEDGSWTVPLADVNIVVHPPWYATWWAQSLYFMLLLGGLYAAWTYLRLRQSYQVERLAHEKDEELNEEKIRFFTNIAHEFRTPLTLILGPLEDTLRQKIDDNQSVRSRLQTVYQNAERMLDLVNQLITFRKIEQGHANLELSDQQLSQFLQHIVTSFKDLAELKGIELHLDVDDNTFELTADYEKLKKVLFNLISNALKFCSKGDSIHVVQRVAHDKVLISVQDTGPGIDQADLDQVFVRFYDKKTNTSNQIKGSGIGLALSKELIEVQGGEITLSSELGLGSTFTVSLPQRAASGHSEIYAYAEPVSSTDPPTDDVVSKEEANAVVNKEDGRDVLLVVEDNEDVLAYIISIFNDRYRCISAANGADGYQRAIREQPSIIISDVMMPVMDGFTMTQRLKGDKQTSHIPILLLTAKTTGAEHVEGLEAGADDYMNKPFHPKELSLKIDRILQARKSYTKDLIQQTDLETTRERFSPAPIVVTSADEEFLQSLLLLMEENIENADFRIDHLTKPLAVSRALLFSKIKSLTGNTPKRFLKSFRMQRAAQLLLTEKLQVSEIAYKVGYRDPKYFSKVFSDNYKVAPSAYVESLKNQ